MVRTRFRTRSTFKISSARSAPRRRGGAFAPPVGHRGQTPNGTILASYAYTLDLAGNRTSVTEHTGRSATWQYDALYRLLNETVQEPGQPTTSESFTYDPVGNRTTQTNAQGSFPHVYDANDRLLSDGRASYTWDPNGNLQSKTDALGSMAYTWDARDRLIQASGSTVGTVDHAYDARGQRVATWTDGVPASYLVDDNRALSQVIEERDGFGSLIAAYVHGPSGEPLARYDGAATTTADFHHDGQGSVRLLTDAAAAVTAAYAYSAFGELVSASGANANPYRYGGQWEEPRTGLYHLRARWMDPGVGRFLSMDPFAGFQGDPASLHRYQYAHANPATMSDPTGLFTLQSLMVATRGALSIAIPNLSRLAARTALRAIGGAAVGAAGGAAFAAAAGDDIGAAALNGALFGAVLGPVAVHPLAAKFLAVAFTGLGAFSATNDALSGNYRRSIVTAVTVGVGSLGAARAGFVPTKGDKLLGNRELQLFDEAISAIRATHPLRPRTTLALGTWRINGQVGQGVAKSGSRQVPSGFLTRPGDPPLATTPGGQFHAEEIVLQNIAAQYPRNATGILRIRVSHHEGQGPCAARCQPLIQRFRELYPGIRLEITP